MAGGRPSKFRPEFVEQARKLIALGAIDADLADFFGVDQATINRWKEAKPEFRATLKNAKLTADERVERSLFERATGYSHEAVKIAVNAGGDVTQVPFIERYPPDTTAAIFWLKNRQPEKWRDVSRQEHTGKDGDPIEVAAVTHRERAKALAALVAKQRGTSAS